MYVCLSVWVCVCASMHVCMCVCVRWYIPLYIWKTAFFQCNTFVLNVIGIYWLEWWIWEKNRQNENQVHGTKGKINNFWTQQSFYQFSVKCLAYSSCVGGFFVRSFLRSPFIYALSMHILRYLWIFMRTARHRNRYFPWKWFHLKQRAHIASQRNTRTFH